MRKCSYSRNVNWHNMSFMKSSNYFASIHFHRVNLALGKQSPAAPIPIARFFESALSHPAEQGIPADIENTANLGCSVIVLTT